MSHGGDIFEKNIVFDYSVSINPMGTPARVTDAIKESLGPANRKRCLAETVPPDYFMPLSR